jgi:hypothetical protein
VGRKFRRSSKATGFGGAVRSGLLSLPETPPSSLTTAKIRGCVFRQNKFRGPDFQSALFSSSLSSPTFLQTRVRFCCVSTHIPNWPFRNHSEIYLTRFWKFCRTAPKQIFFLYKRSNLSSSSALIRTLSPLSFKKKLCFVILRSL